jgi:hypothetical protein
VNGDLIFAETIRVPPVILLEIAGVGGCWEANDDMYLRSSACMVGEGREGERRRETLALIPVR